VHHDWSFLRTATPGRRARIDPRSDAQRICLPDETCLLQRPERPATNDVRRLVPARDDAQPVYLQEQGTTLGKSGDQLVIKSRQEVLQKVRLIDVSQVCLFGNVQVTAQALREITAIGIPVCHFSYGGWFHAVTVGMAHNNVQLRLAQFRTATDASRSLDLARQFVAGKIKNCRTLVRRHLDGDSQPLLRQLAELSQKAESAADAASLLGIEGTAAREYFAGFAKLLKACHGEKHKLYIGAYR